MLHASFKIIGLLVPREDLNLKGFTVYGIGSHLGQVTWIISFPLAMEALIGQTVSEKMIVENNVHINVYKHMTGEGYLGSIGTTRMLHVLSEGSSMSHVCSFS